jgi:putative Mg2+ transporter-C (MgtC) family protein
MISIQTALLRLGLALLLGALVGLERERGERAAGLRTHALVALGSCLIMIVSAFGFADILGTHNVVLDPSRIAAQVVSGIGFLGAGTILFRKEIVRGLTTAAAIWVVAAIGLACGAGLLIEAGLTTALTLTVLTFMRPLREYLHRTPEAHQFRIKVVAEDEALLSNVYNACIEAGVTIENMELKVENSKKEMKLDYVTNDVLTLTKKLVTLRTAPGVESITIHLRNSISATTPLPLFEEREEE